MKIINLFLGECRKYIAEIKRYFFNTVSGLVIFYIIFLAMFFGLRGFAGPGFDENNLDSLVVGYILWMQAMMAFQSVSYMLTEETQRGTLEQLCLCSMGMEWPLILRTILDAIFNFLFTLCILYITMLTTGRWLQIDIPRFAFILLISVPSVWGLGLFFGSLTMLFKKVQQLLQIVTFGLIAVVSISAYPISSITFLPFAAGATTVQGMIRGKSFPMYWYGIIVLVSTMYMAIGIIFFKLIEKTARRRNLLNQY